MGYRWLEEARTASWVNLLSRTWTEGQVWACGVEGAVRSTQREHRHPGQVCRDCVQGTGSGATLLDGMRRQEEVLGGSLVDVKGLDTSLRSCYSLWHCSSRECSKLLLTKGHLGKLMEWIWGKKKRLTFSTWDPMVLPDLIIPRAPLSQIHYLANNRKQASGLSDCFPNLTLPSFLLPAPTIILHTDSEATLAVGKKYSSLLQPSPTNLLQCIPHS